MKQTQDQHDFLAKKFAGAQDQDKLSDGKLILLGLISMALCSFGPLSFFASVPITIAILLFGRQKSFLLMGGVFLLSAVLASQLPPLVYLPFIFLSAGIMGVLNSETILRKWKPMKGVIIFGSGFLLALAFLVAGLVIINDISLSQFSEKWVETFFLQLREQNQELLTSGGEQARILEDFISEPKKVASQMLQWAPAMLFILTFFTLWACQFLILRNTLVWKFKHNYPYSTKDLITYKNSDFMLWPLIISLAFAVAGKYFLTDLKSVEFIGVNILYAVGIFYFFQGFGVYIQFLSFARIGGILRTVLVLFTVTMAWRLIVLVGIFDVWINFEKYLVRKKEE